MEINLLPFPDCQLAALYQLLLLALEMLNSDVIECRLTIQLSENTPIEGYVHNL
jgi:hypothetical protein